MQFSTESCRCREVQTSHCGKANQKNDTRGPVTLAFPNGSDSVSQERTQRADRSHSFRCSAERARTESRSTAHYSHLVCFRLHGAKEPSSCSCPGDSQHSGFALDCSLHQYVIDLSHLFVISCIGFSGFTPC